MRIDRKDRHSFVDAVTRRLDDARTMPERFPKVHNDVQQALLQRFPFVLYFGDLGERIFVLSVFHASRDPASLWVRVDG
jgi:toxin ParE1/3/4